MVLDRMILDRAIYLLGFLEGMRRMIMALFQVHVDTS